MKKIFLLLLVLLATATLVNAVQPTQQSNKIFLDPFYRASTTLNTNYNYTMSVNPPDKISKVLSAIITFKVYMTPTVTFNLTVNGQPCNNPTFTVSTTYASSGQGEVSFDCSNRITQAGNYSMILRVTSANTGAIQGWLDLTYMNNPTGDIEVSGTEYSPGDPATMFVQLKDSYGNAIQNGSCYLDIWYPLNGSGVHPYAIQDAPMLQAIGDDGIYYYDMTAPSILGVHMLSAKCAYSFNWVWFYPPTELVRYPIPSNRTGTWLGNTSALNDKGDDVYERCDSTAGVACQSVYAFNTSSYGLISNVTTINLYWAGQGDVAGKTVTFAYWNGTAYVNLPNILTVVATGATATVPGDVDQFVTNSIPASAIRNNTILIRYTGQTGLARLYNNWLSIALLSSTGTIQDVKGSSEMHITNLANASLTLVNAQLPALVWNYTIRNLTYYNMTDTTNYTRIDNTIYAINTSINTNIDNTRINLTTRINQLEATMIAYFNNISLNVWNYATRTLTAFGFDNTNYTRIQTEVWNATNRNLTYYPAQTDMTNYSRISNLTALDVWTYTTRNLTYYQNFSTPQVDLTNYTLITQNVWTYITRTLTASPENVTAIANAVWTSNTRNLTYYPAQTDMTNYSLIGLYVWNATTRDLTYYQNFTEPQVDLTNYSRISNLTANDVWTYANRNLTYYQNFTEPQVDLTNYTLINDGVSAAVWVYTTRNLTYYQNFTEPQVDLTNYSKISNLTAMDVWTYTIRNLTYYAPAFVNNTEVAIAVWNSTTRDLTYYPAQVDLTNYSAINEGVWTYIDRNLTYFPPQVDLTNYNAINSGVWAYTNRTLTYYPTPDLTNYTLISEGVWTYNDRNLTYYPTQVDLTNYSKISNLTAQDVWTYATRDLTYYQVNNISAQDVWTYINRTLTYYEVNNISATDVWAYNNRTLTYYPSQQDLTNYSAIWTYPDRNLTYYPPASVNNTAVAAETWNYSARYTHGELITG